MTCTITNQARRIVSFRGNSGQTWHLPPNATVEVMDVELTDNAKIQKLAAKGVVVVQAIQKAEAAPGERGRRSRS
jgi:hypothetical protein